MPEGQPRPRFLHETHSQQLHREAALRRRQLLAARETARPPAMHFGPSRGLRAAGRPAKSVSPAPRAAAAEEPHSRARPLSRSAPPPSRSRSRRPSRPAAEARKPPVPRSRSYRRSPGASRRQSPAPAQRTPTPPPQQEQEQKNHQQREANGSAQRTRKRSRSVSMRPPFLTGSPLRKNSRTPTPPPQPRGAQDVPVEVFSSPLRAMETAPTESLVSATSFALPRSTLHGAKNFDMHETVEEEHMSLSIGEFRVPCTPKCRASRQTLSASPRPLRAISFAPTLSPHNVNGEEPLRLHSAEAAEEPVAVEVIHSQFAMIESTPLAPIGGYSVRSTEQKVSLTVSGNSWHAYECSTTTAEQSALGHSPVSEDLSREERRQLFAQDAGITPTDEDEETTNVVVYRDDNESGKGGDDRKDCAETRHWSSLNEEVKGETVMEEEIPNRMEEETEQQVQPIMNENDVMSKEEKSEELVQSNVKEGEDDVMGKEEKSEELVQSNVKEDEGDVMSKEEKSEELVQSNVKENDEDAVAKGKPITHTPATAFSVLDEVENSTASQLFADCVSAPLTPELQLPDAYRQLEATRREMASQQRHTRRAEERRSESRRGSIVLAAGDPAAPRGPVLHEPHTPPPPALPPSHPPERSSPTRLACLTRSPIPRPVTLRSRVASPAPLRDQSAPCPHAAPAPDAVALSKTPPQRSRSRSATGRKSALERLMESCPPDAREEAEQLIAADAAAAVLTPMRIMGSGQLSDVLTDSSTISQRVAARPRKYYYDYTYWERHLNEITSSAGRRKRKRTRKHKKAAVVESQNEKADERLSQNRNAVATKKPAQTSLRNSLSKKNRDRIIAQRRMAARRHQKKR